jgi:hypothetical protein
MSDKPSVVEALSKVMDAVQAVKKGQRNPEHGYVFRGIDAVVNAVGPELRKHGVLVMPVLENASYRDVTTSRGKPSRECTVQVRYRFYGPAGDFIEAVTPGESMDHGDKGTAKAMSVAYRIALLQALCIPTDDPEPDSQTYERAHRDEWEQAAKPPTPEQVEHYEALAKKTRAMTRKDFALVASAVKQATGTGWITQAQYAALDAIAGERIKELTAGAEPVGDGGEPNG